MSLSCIVCGRDAETRRGNCNGSDRGPVPWACWADISSPLCSAKCTVALAKTVSAMFPDGNEHLALRLLS